MPTYACTCMKDSARDIDWKGDTVRLRTEGVRDNKMKKDYQDEARSESIVRMIITKWQVINT